VENCFTPTQRISEIDTSIGIRDDTDANRERSARVTRAIEPDVAFYKELYRERQKATHQLSLHHFLREVTVANSLALQDSSLNLCSILTTILQVI
jgi:endonuclease/exonuclease/phosphatase family metal-dependent hydrolase